MKEPAVPVRRSRADARDPWKAPTLREEGARDAGRLTSAAQRSLRNLDIEDQSIAPVPEGVDLATAAATPLAGIVAVTAVDALDLSEGDIVLIAG